MTQLATSNKAIANTAIDPVCGMKVIPGKTKLVSVYRGHSYWFCAQGCREAFEAHPQKYLDTTPPKRKGWLGRFLDRLGRANEEEFGKGGPRCCH